MKQSKYQRILEQLLKEPIFKASDASFKGISSRMLAHFCQKGVIERVGRGLYRVAEASRGVNLDFEELVLTTSSISKGGVCLVLALCYYNLTDQIMREYAIITDNSGSYHYLFSDNRSQHLIHSIRKTPMIHRIF